MSTPRATPEIAALVHRSAWQGRLVRMLDTQEIGAFQRTIVLGDLMTAIGLIASPTPFIIVGNNRRSTPGCDGKRRARIRQARESSYAARLLAASRLVETRRDLIADVITLPPFKRVGPGAASLYHICHRALATRCAMTCVG